MAVDISGGEGALFWSAGIDTSDFDAGMQKILDAVQLSLKKQVEIQTQAAGTQKQLAQSILQSAGALEGLDKGFGKQIQNLSGYDREIGKVSAALSAGVAAIEQHVNALKGETIELNTKGFDVAPLIQSLEKLETELEKVKGGKIEIKAGQVDLSALSYALKQVQEQYDALSEPVKVNVDTSALNSVEPVFSQASVDAFRQASPMITEAVRNFKLLQQEAAAAGTSVAGVGEEAKGAATKLDGLKERIASLGKTSLQLKAAGIDTSTFDTSLEKMRDYVARLENTALHVPVDLDTESFQKHYNELLQEVERLENLSIEFKAAGVDTTAINNDLAVLRKLITDALGESLPVKVDDASITKSIDGIKAKIDALKAEAVALNVTVDTDSLGKSLESIKSKLSELDSFELTGTVDFKDEAFQAKYQEIQQEIAVLESHVITLQAAGLDTSGIEEDLARLKEELVLPPVEVPIKTGSLREKMAELDQLKQKFTDLSEVDRNSDIGAGLVQNIQRVEGEIENINSAFLQVEQNAAGSLNEKVAALQRLKNEYAALSEVDRNSTAGKQLAQNIHNLDRDVQNINKQFQQTEGLVKKAALALGAYVSLQAGTNFIKDLVRVRGEYQQLTVAFNTMLGSKEKADKLMAEVTQFAATTPFELQDVAAASKQLLAFGVDAEKVVSTIRSLGDVASGIGAPLGDIAYLYGTIKTAGIAQGEDIRQFAQRGIPIYEELAKVLQVDVDKVKDLVSAGKVGFPEIEKAFQNMTAEGSKFGGLMEAQSKTLTGQLSNLSDAWNQMLNNIGQSNEGLFSGAISAATSLVQNYQTVISTLEAVLLAYGSYKAAVLATTAYNFAAANAVKVYSIATKELSVAQTLQATATAIADRATKALNATMLANPYAVAIAGVAALAGAFLLFRNEVVESKSKADLLIDSQQKIGDQLAQTQAQIAPYVEQLKTANLSEQERLDIYNKLKDISPEIVSGINAESLSYEKLTENVNGYLDSVRRKVELEGNQDALTASAKQETEIKRQLRERQAEVERLQKAYDEARKSTNAYELQAAGSIGTALQNAKNDVDRLTGALAEQQSTSQELTGDIIDLQRATGNAQKAMLLQIKALEAQQTAVEKTSQSYQDLESQINSLKDALEAVSAAELVSPQAGNIAGPKSNKQLIDEKKSIKELADFRKTLDEQYQAETDAVKRKQLSDDLKYADARKKLLDPYNAAKADEKAQKAAQAHENKINELLQKRADLLKTIADLKDDAAKVGNTKEETEIDKINKKYDEVLEKVAEYNRKAVKLGGQQIGQVAINDINTSRNAEISATIQRQAANAYKKEIEDQKKIFDDFEAYKLQEGEQKAQALYGEQTKGFKSYVDKLVSELDRLKNDNSTAGQLKKDFLNQQLTQAVQDDSKRRYDNEVAKFKQLLDLTKSFYQQRQDIETKYTKLRETLDKNAGNLTSDQYENALQALEKAKNKEIEVLNNTATKATGIYEKLGKDTINLSRQQIIEQIKFLIDYLKRVPNLNPQIKIDIQGEIEKLRGLVTNSDDVTSHLTKFIQEGSKVGQAFDTLAASIDNVDSSLASMLRSIGGIVAGLVNAASAYKDFQKAKEDQASGTGSALGTAIAGAGLIGAAVGVVSGVVNAISGIFKKAKQSRIDTENEIAAFNQRVLEGEMQITEEKRQQQREQVKLNKLKIQGLQDEKKLLEDQRKAVQDQYNDILNQLAKQTAVIAEQPEKYGGFLGIGTKRRVKEITESLAGKSYDELEALFNKGQLVGKAKELFEMLQKLKQEGADIDQMLEDNKRAAAELFTGTTADTIVDSIADGFKRGLRSAADFASSFQDLMQQALIQSLKVRVLEGPIKELFDKFSDATQSGDQLTQTEIADLQSRYNQIIENAAKQFDQLQQIAGVNFSSSSSAAGSSNNTIQGSFKAITEDTANLLAGQFGGLRLTNVGILNVSTEQLSVARQQVEIMLESRAFARENMQTLQKIEINTAQAVRELAAQNEELAAQTRFWKDVTTGAKQIHMA